MLGRERDFTEEIFGAMGSELGKSYVDTNTGTFVDWWQDLFTRNRESIGNEVKSIENYLNRVCEQNDITNTLLNEIFTAVRGVESTYSSKTTEVVALLTDYRDLMTLFRDTMRDFVHNETDTLNMAALKEDIVDLCNSIQERRLAIDEKFAEELEAALGTFVNEDGSYNWDAIEEAMAGDPDTITEAALMALTLTYLSMESPEDVNRFLYLGYDGGIPENLMTDDGSQRTFYGGAEMTEIFRRIAGASEQVAVTTAYIYYNQNGELSEEVQRMLRNAQMASYAVAYASEGGWMVVTMPDGSVVIENGPCMASTDPEGNMNFYANGSVQFSYSSQYIGLDDFDEFINQYADENRISGSDVAWNVASDVALSTTIAIALTLAVPATIAGCAALATVVSIGVGAVVDTAKGTLSEILGANAQNESLSNLVRTSASMAAYGLLGAEVYIIGGSDSRYWFFGANLNTVRNALYTQGFINSDVANKYGLSQSELEAIINNGNPVTESWTPLENSRLTEAEQRAIYEQYTNYIKTDGANRYENTLNSYLNDHPELSSAPPSEDGYKSINDCTPEEIRNIIASYNEDKASR